MGILRSCPTVLKANSPGCIDSRRHVKHLPWEFSGAIGLGTSGLRKGAIQRTARKARQGIHALKKLSPASKGRESSSLRWPISCLFHVCIALWTCSITRLLKPLLMGRIGNLNFAFSEAFRSLRVLAGWPQQLNSHFGKQHRATRSPQCEIEASAVPGDLPHNCVFFRTVSSLIH
jgi:hypothetical protein